MIESIRSIFRKIMSIFNPAPSPPAERITDHSAEKLNAGAVAARPDIRPLCDIENNKVSGNFTTLSSLLDSLDECYETVRRLKPKRSQQQLKVIKKVGIFMPGNSGIEYINYDRLEGGPGRHYPAYMSHCTDGLTNKDSGYMRQVFYAERVKWRIGLGVEKPQGEIVYHFGAAVVPPKDEKGPKSPIEIWGYIEVDDETGQARVLKHSAEINNTIQHKDGSKTAYKYSSWRNASLVGAVYLRLREDKKRERADQGIKDSRNNLAMNEIFRGVDEVRATEMLFHANYAQSMQRMSSTTIHATKNGIRLVFSVPIHSWKTFFRDRIAVTGANGKRKAIYHHVAAHTRRGGQVVPMHSRGIKKFGWKGWNIHICPIKRGAFGVADFDIPGTQMSREEEREYLRSHKNGLLSPEQVASKILAYELNTGQ